MTPTVEDLSERARRNLETDYASRLPREEDGSKRQSRSDWQAGYLAALARYCPGAVFTRDALEHIT